MTPSATRPRYSLYIIPVVAVIAAVFGLFYGYVGVQTLLRGDGRLALLFIVFGFGGIALGIALYTTWKRMVRQ